jgi:cell division septum initiation protein DivIVA
VELRQLIDRLRSMVETARSMPMSASVVVNKTELLGAIDELEASLPAAFAEAERAADHDGVVARARAEAERIVAEANRERDRLLADADVVTAARDEVARLRADADKECRELRRETDEYVDGRLANLELSLTKTLEAVARGRERLQGRSELDELRSSDDGPDFAFPD